MEILVLVRHVELEHFRQRDRFRKLQTAAIVGDIADDAIHAGQPVVEIDPSLDEGLVADNRATLYHRIHPLRSSYRSGHLIARGRVSMPSASPRQKPRGSS